MVSPIASSASTMSRGDIVAMRTVCTLPAGGIVGNVMTLHSSVNAPVSMPMMRLMLWEAVMTCKVWKWRFCGAAVVGEIVSSLEAITSSWLLHRHWVRTINPRTIVGGWGD